MLREKPSFYDKKKSNTASTRLTKAATAVRSVISRSVFKLGRKTLLAVIDHLTQTLPGPNGDFVTPILQDYVKALTDLLSRQAHVELLARKEGKAWEICVEFLLDVAVYALPRDQEAGWPSSSRNSPAPGASAVRSTVRSSSSTQSQKRMAQVDTGPLKDALQGLCYLTSGVNAPLHRWFKDITETTLRILQNTQLSLGSLQSSCFSIINTMFSAMQADEVQSGNNLVKDLMPLMAYWWRAEKVSQDEVIRTLRNEISRSILLMHLHMEHLVLHCHDVPVRSNLESLTEPLWQEYSKRGEAFRLQLMDVNFASHSSRANHPSLPMFTLRPNSLDSESHWFSVQNLSTLEGIILRAARDSPAGKRDESEQPRKRRKMEDRLSRILLRLSSPVVGVRRTALQLVPFLVATDAVDKSDILQLLDPLLLLAGDKDPSTASWALVACAQYEYTLGPWLPLIGKH